MHHHEQGSRKGNTDGRAVLVRCKPYRPVWRYDVIVRVAGGWGSAVRRLVEMTVSSKPRLDNNVSDRILSGPLSL